MRIRTIKPEFWSSAKMAKVPREVRLLFIGLWNEADDDGRLLGSPKRLAGSLFEHDTDVDGAVMDGWLAQLERTQLIIRYEVKGTAYVAIPGFGEHQRIDKRWASRLPPPPERLAQHCASLAGQVASPAEHCAPDMILSGNVFLPEMTPSGSVRAEATEPPHAPPAVGPEAEDQPDPPPSTEQRLERRESAAVVRSGYRAQIAGSRAAAGASLGRPQTVDDLLALHVVESPDGRVSVVPDSVVTLQQVWRSRYGALDGKGNPRRPSIAEVLERVWPSSLNKGWDLSGSQLLAWWSGILSTEANRVRLAWEKDGGASSSGTHPLWSEWRNLRNSRDMPPFEEWLLQREREPAQQVGSGRRPQGPASGATAVARVVTAVLDAQANAAAEVFNDEAGYSSGLAMMKAANARATTPTTTTTKTTKPGVLQ